MNLHKLPPELIDKIILYTDLRTAIISKNIYYINQLYKPHIHTWKWACINNQIEVVKWLYENDIPGRDHYAMDLASKNGYLEIVKYLHTHRNKINYVPYKYDHEYYTKYIEPYILEQTNGCSTNAMDWAAKNGHLNTVKYLHSIGKMGSIMSIYYATKNKHYEIVKFLDSSNVIKFLENIHK